MPNRKAIWRRTALALALALLLGSQGAWADSATWLGTTTNYNLTTNWSGTPASVPGNGGSGETATFTNTGAGAVNIGTATTNGVGFSFSTSQFNDYTITVADGVNQGLTGLTTTGGGNVTLAASGTGTYTLAGAPTIFNIQSDSNIQYSTVSGVITGANALQKDGYGNLILSGANTYSGGTTLNAGYLYAGNNNAFGTGTLTINGGTLGASAAGIVVGNNLAIGGDFTLGGLGGSSLELTHNLDLGAHTLTSWGTSDTLSGVVSGTGSIVVSGGTLTLSGANTYNGGTTVTNYNVAANNNAALGTGALTLNGGTLLNSSGAGVTLSNSITIGGTAGKIGGTAGNDLTLTGTIKLGGLLAVLNSADTTLTGLISGTRAITQNSIGGTGTLTLRQQYL